MGWRGGGGGGGGRGSHLCLGAKIPCMYAITIYNINMVYISVQVQRGTYYEQVSSSSKERLQFFKKDTHMIGQQTILHALIT